MRLCWLNLTARVGLGQLAAFCHLLVWSDILLGQMQGCLLLLFRTFAPRTCDRLGGFELCEGSSKLSDYWQTRSPTPFGDSRTSRKTLDSLVRPPWAKKAANEEGLQYLKIFAEPNFVALFVFMRPQTRTTTWVACHPGCALFQRRPKIDAHALQMSWWEKCWCRRDIGRARIEEAVPVFLDANTSGRMADV